MGSNRLYHASTPSDKHQFTYRSIPARQSCGETSKQRLASSTSQLQNTGKLLSYSCTSAGLLRDLGGFLPFMNPAAEEILSAFVLNHVTDSMRSCIARQENIDFA